MTATDDLRRMLDERGEFWMDIERPDRKRTCWGPGSGTYYYYDEMSYGVCWFEGGAFTPQQAIDATLGRGTCEVECFDDGVDEGLDGGTFSYAPPTWYLSCGHEVCGSVRPCYCSACGKKVAG